jgi:Flp pilus assembly protein TadD
MTNRPADSNRQELNLGICILLAAITLAVFSPTIHYGFVNCDDSGYVYENPVVQQGLTLKGIGWAFTHVVVGNWHPLTVISLMADYQVHGLNPGGYHLTNVLLHTIAVILLFLVLTEMTGCPWRCAFVAAIFAIHPLRLESVAWISERKDVLSGVFFMLTLWAYVRYVKQVQAQNSKFKISYGLVLLFFALALMCKPMLVTVPFVLLLLDYWPLNRFSNSVGPWKKFSITKCILFEKLPLLALSLAACVAAVLTQKSVVVSDAVPAFSARVDNALVAYLVYIRQLFYPAGLAFFYPFPVAGPALGKVALSLAVLAAVSAAVLVNKLKRPYLLVGWLWYLGMLVPVLGLVQAGLQAHANRYTYLPEIGLCLALTWLGAELCTRRHFSHWWLGSAAVLIIAGLSVGTRARVSDWRDSESLWNHTLTCTADNLVAHDSLGEALLEERRVDEAIVHFRKALEIQPDNILAQTDLAAALYQKGQVSEAIDHFRKALALRPADALSHYNLGVALFYSGQVDEAAGEFRKAMEIQPDYTRDLSQLGNAALHRGQVNEAMVLFQTLLQVRPDDAEAHYALGVIFLQKRQVHRAIAHLQASLKSQPDNAGACNELAWVLATSPDPTVRNGTKALELAQQANVLSGGRNPMVLATLAAANAEAGHFPEAIATARQALQWAANQNNAGTTAIATALQEQLKLYQAGSPLRDANLKDGSTQPNPP